MTYKEKHDLAAERVIISYLIQYGSRIYPEIECHLNKTDFHSEQNKVIFQCVSDMLKETEITNITIDSILTSAKKLNLEKLLSKQQDIEYLKLCQSTSTNLDEIKIFLKKIKTCSIINKLHKKLQNVSKKLSTYTGDEKLTDVISNTEKSIFDFVPELLNQNDIVDMSDFIPEYILYLQDNPVKLVGLPTGFPKYDQAIGGGYRRGTVNIIAARPKVGKSTICLNMAHNLSKQDVPVLYLDTELNKEIQAVKLTSLVSEVDQASIEKGSFSSNEFDKEQISKSLEKIKKLPFYLINVAGNSVEETLSVMRRWLSQYVGRDENGKIKDCLIILDYLKTMDIKEAGRHDEHQFLGDYMTKLQTFAVQYDLPILSAVQLNRDGISRQDTASISASDRIVWFCSNMTILKRKTDEDFASGDNKNNGDRKLIVIETRFGEGMDPTNEYINVISNLNIAQFIEGKYNYEVIEEDFSVDDLGDDEAIQF